MFFRKSKVPEIDAATLHGKLKSDKPPRLLDVREPDEHDDGIIPSAIKIPMRELSRRFAEIVPDRETEIVVYCRSGHRSHHSAEQLINAGYKNVSSLQGGIMAWFRQGYEVKLP